MRDHNTHKLLWMHQGVKKIEGKIARVASQTPHRSCDFALVLDNGKSFTWINVYEIILSHAGWQRLDTEYSPHCPKPHTAMWTFTLHIKRLKGRKYFLKKKKIENLTQNLFFQVRPTLSTVTQQPWKTGRRDTMRLRRWEVLHNCLHYINYLSDNRMYALQLNEREWRTEMVKQSIILIQTTFYYWRYIFVMWWIVLLCQISYVQIGQLHIGRSG